MNMWYMSIVPQALRLLTIRRLLNRYQTCNNGGSMSCGISTVVVRLLPKQETPVRFWYPAQSRHWTSNVQCHMIVDMVSTVDELINKIDVYYKQGPEVAILLIKRDLLKMRLTDSKSKPHVSNTNTITTLDIIVQYAPISQQDVVRHFPALSQKTVRR